MIYLASDNHWWHGNVIGFCNRPFTSVEYMNEKMVEKWNLVVKPEDTVYYLGDFSLAIRPVETITPRLNGIKKIVPGNHDWIFPNHKKFKKDPQKWTNFYQDAGWEILPIHYELNIDGLANFNLCHFPYENDMAHMLRDGKVVPDKYAQWRLKDTGRWLIHGHVHQHGRVKGRMINVGVDAWAGFPVSIDQIAEIVAKGPTNLARLDWLIP